MTLVGVFLASLAGSLHCAGMCGGFAGMCSVPQRGSGSRGFWAPAAYQFGRLFSYTAVGAILGGLGASIDLVAEELTSLQRISSILMLATLVFFAARTYLGRTGGKDLVQLGAAKRTPKSRLPGRLYWFGQALRSLVERPGARGAGSLGLLSALLPCGWLWSFWVLAAGTADPLLGASLMAVFWAGTVPALLSISLAGGWIGRRARGFSPAFTAVLVITVGFASFWQRAPSFTADAQAHATPPACHGEH